MVPHGEDAVELLPGFEPASPPADDLEFREEGSFEDELLEFGGVEALLPSLLAGPDAAAILLHSKSQPALNFPLLIPASHSSPESTCPSQHRLPGVMPQSAGQDT